MSWKRSERLARVANRFEQGGKRQAIHVETYGQVAPGATVNCQAVQEAYELGRRRR